MVDHYSAHWVVRFSAVVLERGSMRRATVERMNTGSCGRCCRRRREGLTIPSAIANGTKGNGGAIMRSEYK
jgi:hypothetical protein